MREALCNKGRSVKHLHSKEDGFHEAVSYLQIEADSLKMHFSKSNLTGRLSIE